MIVESPYSWHAALRTSRFCLVATLVCVAAITRAEAQVWVWSPPAALDPSAATDNRLDDVHDLSTDGAGTWIVAWDARNQLGGALGNDFDAVFTRSTDAGVTWSAPAALNSDATIDSGDDRKPRMAGSGTGTWVAVWEYFSGSTDFEIGFARSTDDGVTWSAPAILNTNAPLDTAPDFKPQIATDGSGTWIVVWMAIPGSNFDALFARSIDDGLTWSAPALLNPSGGSPGPHELDPYVATDRQGTWIAAWDTDDSFGGTLDGRHIVFARSTDNGMTWSSSDVLDGGASAPSFNDFPQLATDGSGAWMATWNAYNAVTSRDEVTVTRSTDSGMTWSTPTVLFPADAPGPASYMPQIATDSAGTWLVVWERAGGLAPTLGTDADVLFARSDDDGVTWNGPGTVNTNAASDAGDDAFAQIRADALGNWVATWSSTDTLGGTIGTDPDLLVARGKARSCAPTPQMMCRGAESGKSLLKMKDKTNDAKDQIQWKWKKGAITPITAFGNPLSADGHLFCLYEAGALIASAAMDAAGTCASKACWQQTSRGFKFKDKELTPDGAQQLKLKAGATPGKAQVTFKGRGANLAMPSLPGITGQLVAQLQRGSNGECWESVFSAPFLKQDAETLKAKAD